MGDLGKDFNFLGLVTRRRRSIRRIYCGNVGFNINPGENLKETIGWGWKIKATQLQLVYFPLGGVRAVKTGLGIKDSRALAAVLELQLKATVC